jgi:hypothetical protein
MRARIASNSTNAGAPPLPWEKQPGETPKRYEAFLVDSRLPLIRMSSLPSPPANSRASIQSERQRTPAPVYKTALRFGAEILARIVIFPGRRRADLHHPPRELRCGCAATQLGAGQYDFETDKGNVLNRHARQKIAAVTLLRA